MTNTATLRDVTVGEGTSYPFMSPPELPGVTARQGLVPLIDGGAAFAGPDVGESGSLPIEVLVDGETSEAVMPLITEVVAAWSPSDAIEELGLVLADESRIYRGRPSGAVPNLQWLIEGHLAAVRLGFTVSDYRWYSSVLRSVTVSAGGSSGGFVSPFVSPFVSTGSGSTGDAAVSNDGTADAPWTAIITGGTTGVVTPRLILNGRTVRLDATIPAGAAALVDSRTASVMLDGQPRPWVSFDSDWWEIPPGQSTFSFRATSGDGTASLTWRDASY